ncbi:hypothetical protein AQUCO_03300007v1 [Aquilegia coerulea]|uniref:Uncharacterized protein n=1 Tax=Aquilegia coerulea TaxID=218851 RepID=A0A2G5CZ28_AQUCA|nr:hypothetical protein AQUCO_03300007v1 [Aquilegia coerulea]
MEADLCCFGLLAFFSAEVEFRVFCQVQEESNGIAAPPLHSMRELEAFFDCENGWYRKVLRAVESLIFMHKMTTNTCLQVLSLR